MLNRESRVLIGADLLCRLVSRNVSKLPSVAITRTRRELQEVCELLYRQYRRRGYCADSAQGIYMPEHITRDETVTFIGRLSDQTTYGTISLMQDGEEGIPADTICKDKLDLLRASGARIAEVGLLATELQSTVSKKYSLKSLDKMRPLFSLYRRMFHYALCENITDLIISVHPRHKNLYSFLGFRQLAAEINYSGACGAKAVTMHLEVDYARKYSSPGIKSLFFTNVEEHKELPRAESRV